MLNRWRTISCTLAGFGLFLTLSAAQAAAQSPARDALRDPALPYTSWGEAQRETAAAIAGRTLARPADGRYAVGDAVIFNDGGKAYRAHVSSLEGTNYDVHYDGFVASWKRRAAPDALLGYQPGYVPGARPAAAPADTKPAAAAATSQSAPATGKYGCTESIYRVTRGEFEFESRGFFVLEPDGRYEFLGLAGTGAWRWDAASGVLHFQGARLDGARATKIDRGPRIRIELPTNDPARPLKWTCSPTDAH